MSPEHPKIICWDLAETLVNTSSTPLMAAPRMHGLLKNLGDRGYVHVLTTGTTLEYAYDDLSRTGLREYFTDLFTKERFGGGDYKLYQRVADEFGLNPDQARRRMLVIGDSERDYPYDTQSLFIFHPRCAKTNAGVLGEVIQSLERADPADFIRAFEVIADGKIPERGGEQAVVLSTGGFVNLRTRVSYSGTKKVVEHEIQI